MATRSTGTITSGVATNVQISAKISTTWARRLMIPSRIASKFEKVADDPADLARREARGVAPRP